MIADGKEKQRRSNDCRQETGRQRARWKREGQEPSRRSEDHEYLSGLRELLSSGALAVRRSERAWVAECDRETVSVNSNLPPLTAGTVPSVRSTQTNGSIVSEYLQAPGVVRDAVAAEIIRDGLPGKRNHDAHIFRFGR